MVNTRRRKQRGGGFWDRFPTLSFELRYPEGHVKSTEMKKLQDTLENNNDRPFFSQDMLSWEPFEKDPHLLRKGHYLDLFEIVEKNNKKEKKPLCSLVFYPRNREDVNMAYLGLIECKGKTPLFKRASFLIMYKLLQILKGLDIEYLYFSVDARNDFWKLYSLYHDMGFVCVNVNDTKTNENDDDDLEYVNFPNLKKEYEERVMKNKEYFSTTVKSIPDMNAKNKSLMSNAMGKRCFRMFGSVAEVMKTIEKYVAAQEGGMKKIFTRNRNGKNNTQKTKRRIFLG